MILRLRCRSHEFGGHRIEHDSEPFGRDQHAALRAFHKAAFGERLQRVRFERRECIRVVLDVRAEHSEFWFGKRGCDTGGFHADNVTTARGRERQETSWEKTG